MKEKLLASIYQNYLSSFLDKNSKTLKIPQIDALSNCIVKWCDFLIKFFGDNIGFLDDPKKFTEHAFLPPEKNLQSNYISGDGTILTVRGRFDCALLDMTSGEVQLVEFKCLKESDPTRELTQLALYAWLVRENMGYTPRTCTLYFEEEPVEAAFSALNTGKIVSLLPLLFNSAIQVIRAVKHGNAEQKIIPKTDHPQLCENCFFSDECDSNFGKTVARGTIMDSPVNVEQSSVVSPNNIISEAEKYLRCLVDYLGKYKLPVEPEEPKAYIIGPRFIRLKIVPVAEKGVTVAKIQKRADDLQIGLQLTHPPLIQTQSGYVSVDVPRRNIEPLTLSPLIQNGEPNRPNSGLVVPLGAEIDGKTFWLNLADPTMSSILIGGTSGSGKSILLQSLVLGLCLANQSVRMMFTLIDPKRVTFT